MIQTPITIVGMGKSGESAQRFLLARGFKKEDVLTFDQKAAAQFTNPDELMNTGQPKTLVVSPGVPLKTPWIVAAAKAGVFITSEINLACEVLTTEKIIGVTGSLGKSTTVSLLGAGLSAFEKTAFVGGNLGTPFCDYAYEVATGKRPAAHWVVLELSSYQLENCRDLKLEHAAITFLSANHMERYNSLEDYYFTKWRIIDKTRGSLFINKNGGDLLEFAKKQPEFSRCIITSKEDKELMPYALSQSALLGVHNQDNMALAAQIALHCHWPSSSLQQMKKFQGLEHRLENLGLFSGIRFINDSKATALDSVSTAVAEVREYLQGNANWHFLIGGRDKTLPWEVLQPLNNLTQTQFSFFGVCRFISKEKTLLPGPQFTHLEDALRDVFSKAKDGDIVLLSPGGTSLDEFKGFEDRGRFFKEKVKSYYSSKS
jgi:UDP-N-acetylmuramoylalanine--D-glutamate ligase